MSLCFVHVGSNRLCCTVARTPGEQALGLQRHAGLADSEGMLFPYTPPCHVTFHMGRVAFPIDLLFVAADETADEVRTKVTVRCDRCGREDELPAGSQCTYIDPTDLSMCLGRYVPIKHRKGVYDPYNPIIDVGWRFTIEVSWTGWTSWDDMSAYERYRLFAKLGGTHTPAGYPSNFETRIDNVSWTRYSHNPDWVVTIEGTQLQASAGWTLDSYPDRGPDWNDEARRRFHVENLAARAGSIVALELQPESWKYRVAYVGGTLPAKYATTAGKVTRPSADKLLLEPPGGAECPPDFDPDSDWWVESDLVLYDPLTEHPDPSIEKKLREAWDDYMLGHDLSEFCSWDEALATLDRDGANLWQIAQAYERGQTEALPPVEVFETGHISDGWHRLVAAYHYGLLPVPARRIGWQRTRKHHCRGKNSLRIARIVHDAQPGTTERWSHPSCSAVIEVRGGWCRDHGVAEGAAVSIPSQKQADSRIRDEGWSTDVHRELADDQPVDPRDRYRDRSTPDTWFDGAEDGLMAPSWESLNGWDPTYPPYSQGEGPALRPQARFGAADDERSAIVDLVLAVALDADTLDWAEEPATAGAVRRTDLPVAAIEPVLAALGYSPEAVEMVTSDEGLAVVADGLVAVGVGDLVRLGLDDDTSEPVIRIWDRGDRWT